ncbi:hypothetical protein BDR07DRAFT_1378611 [Suillus spraguei]|nr:hypothetical protein BDR07DRAFT_1378611 [Suillus spraguei]
MTRMRVCILTLLACSLATSNIVRTLIFAALIDVHVSLGIGTRDRDSTHVYLASRSITRQMVQPSADNGRQDALHQPAPQRITPVPSCTLANALRPDIRGVLEPCLWPPQHTVHNYITARRVVTSEFDDSLVSLYLTHVPISKFGTLDETNHQVSNESGNGNSTELKERHR